MKEIAHISNHSNIMGKPASIRLMDNLQFQLGRVMKPSSKFPFPGW